MDKDFISTSVVNFVQAVVLIRVICDDERYGALHGLRIPIQKKLGKRGFSVTQYRVMILDSRAAVVSHVEWLMRRDVADGPLTLHWHDLPRYWVIEE